MTIAIAMNQDRPAGHFMKAEHFALFDDDGQALAQFANPRVTEGCGAKNALIAMLKANQVTRVVTRHIGEHALAGLFDAGLHVYQLTNGRLNPTQWLSPAYWQPLTDASQGRPALQRMKQQQQQQPQQRKAACHSGRGRGCGAQDSGIGGQHRGCGHGQGQRGRNSGHGCGCHE
ncbi:NifB/NifX family molybdenum-iron cluster-binding protein [Salinivibrio costicola]|uniref:Dinitrogenase iron-molybdenum cofactor biosynthesis domain-containing protein n=1 Tax=Salinivibrio costicola subsp. alcaliphilus TaxID=272773 RepID=A0ABX3KTF1_SALCS|nr:NifB/NifX family molybdenum-iron cluster-binding protein [Salinivibrio costicola]OOF34688.1 hypothetical protein BZJ21_04055 [Salinivibrio costicola subsp. alcaliphilus]